jgi:hypothetical protein
MEPLNANDAQRYAEFKEWTPFEAALLLAGCKPLPRSHIPEPNGNTPAFNLIQAIQHCGPSKNLGTPHPPETWMLWYFEYLAGYDFPEFSQVALQALANRQPQTFQITPQQYALTTRNETALKSGTLRPLVHEQAVSDGSAPATKPTNKRLSWRDVAMPYIVATYRVGKYKTAHTFYVALVNKAEVENSPFTLRDRELFLTNIGQSVSEKTIANAMPEIKTAAIQPLI